MAELQLTYNDVENILATASKETPYLVYSQKSKNVPKQSSRNTVKGRPITVRWASEAERDYNVFYILDYDESLALSKLCLQVRANGGKVKFRETVYKRLQGAVAVLNTKHKESLSDIPVTKKTHDKLVAKDNGYSKENWDRYMENEMARLNS